MFLSFPSCIQVSLEHQNVSHLLTRLPLARQGRVNDQGRMVRAIARKAPQALSDLRQAILASQARILRDPAPEQVSAHPNLICHAADVPVVLAAMQAQVDYLVTLNRKHFIDDPSVAHQAGLRIGTPGEALRWVREQISSEER